MLIDYTIEQFIHSNIFLGYLKKHTIESSYNYLLGYRYNLTIIKLSLSILHCKKLYEFLTYFFQNYGSL